MNQQISQREAVFRYARLFLAQYLSTVHGYDSFQNEALNMLAHYFLQIVRSMAVKIKSILNLQGRTIPNSLHILAIIEQLQLMSFQDLLTFITKRKQAAMDTRSLQIIDRLGKKIFQNDLETVNNYEKQKSNANIRYIPPIFVTDLNKKALPYKHTVDEAFEMPPEITYQETKQKIIREKKNIQLLSAYTKRENKIALTGFFMDQQKDRKKRLQRQKKQANNQIDQIYGQAPQKRQKFSSIQYI